MLLEEDPAMLIAATAANFSIDPDRRSLSRITSSLSTLSDFRSRTISDHRQRLGALKRQEQTLNSQHQMTVESHNSVDHAAEILRLDTEKFRVAKQASDLEVEGERLSMELEGLRGTLETLEAEGVDGREDGEGRTNYSADEAETILKLKVYRTLGIDVEADPATGTYDRAIVRNASKGDVHVVNLDPKFSRFFYANWFWKTL